jgi:predicted aspartyl protease
MPRLIIRRSRAADPIHIRLHIFNPATGHGVAVVGLFDTGNDHTAIRRDLSERLGLAYTQKKLSVVGVTGASGAGTSIVTLGLDCDDAKKITIDDHEVAIVDRMSDEVLIGRDFLERFDVAIGRDGTFMLSC